MEALAPEHLFLIKLKIGLEGGKTPHAITKLFIEERPGDSFSMDLAQFIFLSEQGVFSDTHLNQQRIFYRKVILQMLQSAHQGEPIYEKVVSVETDIRRSCEEYINKFMGRLKFLSLIPLVLFMFPAFLLLLFGPIVTNLLRELGS